MRVLIVDDNADIRAVMRIMLEVAGYDVIDAMHGGIGLTRVADDKPDAVLLDLMMPEVDGFEFLARLPDVTSAPPPVIVISGFDTYRDEVTKLGAFAYLEKPVDTKVLLRTLADALAHRGPDAQLLQKHREEHARGRDRAREQAQELVRRIPLSDQRVMPALQAIVDWLPRFFGFGTSIVQTLRGNDLMIEAVGGDLINGRGMFMKPGMSIPRQWSFCDDLLDEGSSLVLPDPRHHRCEAVSSHSEVKRLGWGFYLGVAIPTSSGIIGALCLLAKEPHAAHTEDADLMTALATRIGAMLEAAATNDPIESVVDANGCFAEDLRPALLEAALKRALRRGRSVALLRVALSAHATPELLWRRIRGLDGISAVLFRDDVAAMTAILAGRERDVTRADVESCSGVDVRGVGRAWWDPPRSAPDLDSYDAGPVVASLTAEATRALALSGGA